MDRKESMETKTKKKITRKDILRAALITIITILVIVGIGLLLKHFGVV
jgi:hypothetical protein